ncbi:MAG: hypothetical protein MUP63_04090, partial [Candidatus Nanohaloarchaeota archaeon QJJ-7]|nr:hypothetical protein [Candidatus Nanohaloarchaeota archaeon QJJ-7]
MKGQFFIITVVILGGMLFSTSAIISSAGATDYNQVVEDHSTGVIENLGEEALSSWWNPSWLWRKSVEVEERSGLYLENESVAIDLDAKRSRVNDSCADIRVVSGGETLPWINTTSCGIDTYESDTGAVMRYVFDRVEGGVVDDVTGNGNTGGLEGNPETVSGKFGGGMSFDGSGDYIAVSDLMYGSSGEIDELTVC